MTRGLMALAAVAVVVALVVARIPGAHRGRRRATRRRAVVGAEPPSDVPPPPADAPAEGMYVLSSVNADGTVEVQTWLRAAAPISELRLTTTDPDLLPGSVESLDLRRP